MKIHSLFNLKAVFVQSVGCVFIVSGIYLLSAKLAHLLFNEGPMTTADWALHVLVALPIWMAFKKRWLFAVCFGVFTLFLHMGHAGKSAILGGPITPDDVFALNSFLMIIKPWQAWIILSITGIAVLSFILGVDWKKPKKAAWLGIIMAFVIALPIVPSPVQLWMDKTFGYTDWNAVGDYRRKGPAIYTLQETARFFAQRNPIPCPKDVAAALPANNDPVSGTSSPIFLRNLHIIVLESFWDAKLLTAATDKDPFPKDFRSLWKKTGCSKILSPVFGGYTANAEFECLCGFPVDEPAVFFERKMTKEVPCLPSVLKSHGYITIASHPNTPVFWNRLNIFKRIGFDKFYAGSDFVYDEMIGDYLSDRSLYRQVMEKITPALDSGKPIFNYILTIFGHLPYPLSDEYPPVLPGHSSLDEVNRYLNTVRYKARDLIDFLKVLRAKDPEGLIVIFGDHIPALGEQFEGYAESGILPRDWADFTPEAYLTLVSTPLIIIDGSKGPVKVGNLPLYRLPALILSLLEINSPSVFDYTVSPKGIMVRPIVALHLNLINDKVEVCIGDSKSDTCKKSAEWLYRMNILAADLFSGYQYAMPKRIEIPERIMLSENIQDAMIPLSNN